MASVFPVHAEIPFRVFLCVDAATTVNLVNRVCVVVSSLWLLWYLASSL